MASTSSPTPVTIKDIANAVGVSDMSVSNAFSGKGRLADETRERILGAARKLGYRPNAASRAIRQGRFSTIGLVRSAEVESGGVSFGTSHGVMKAAMAHDLHVTTGHLPGHKFTSASEMPKLLREWSADGLLLTYNVNVPQRLLEIVQRFRIPCIWLNAKMSHDCVYPDDFGAMHAATRRLIDLGHKRIAYLSPTRGGHYSTADRYDGYRTAMEQAGYQPFAVEAEPIDAFEPMRAVLASSDRPTAVVTVGYPIETYFAAQACGLRVPDDLSIVTLRDPAYTAMRAQPEKIAGMPITAIDLPVYEIGECGVELLIQKIKRPDRQLDALMLPCKLSEGGSDGPCRSDNL